MLFETHAVDVADFMEAILFYNEDFNSSKHFKVNSAITPWIINPGY